MSNLRASKPKAPVERLRREPAASPQKLLERLIAADQIEPGGRLPPEGELASALGLGRSSVREGTRALESLGIVETRQGSGTYLRQRSLDALVNAVNAWHEVSGGADLDGMLAVEQAREAMEIGLVDEVISRASGESKRDVLRALETMERNAEADSYDFESDTAFHLALYQPLGNWILLELVRALCVLSEDLEPSASPAVVARSHRVLYDALEAGDKAAFLAAMRAHFQLL